MCAVVCPDFRLIKFGLSTIVYFSFLHTAVSRCIILTPFLYVHVLVQIFVYTMHIIFGFAELP